MSTVVDLESLGSSGFAARGAAPGDGAGGSVAVIGDFNGDGFDDFVIGAPGNDSGGSNSGAAYLIYGKPGGFGTLDLANLQPGDGFQIQGHMGGSNAGLSVASAGDVNGDGFDDFLVGSAAHGLFGYGWNLGAAVIFGRAEKPTGIDLTGYSPQIFSGIGTGYYGVVASAGDINGDGFDDIILGSQFDSGGAGAAYVIFGKESAWTSMDGTDLGSNGFVIDGTDLVSVGESVSSAGDINGDGFDEIIVTAREEGVYPYGSTPAAYVIFGKETGFADVDLSSLAPTDGFLIQSQYEFYSNRVWVASAGDVNGDDFADILIRVPASNGYAGSAYVIFGKEDGFGQIYLATLGSSSGFAIQGMSHSGAGASVSAAGDFNGDGFDDLLIGAPNAGSSYSGDAVVIFGRETGFGTIDLSTLAPSDGFIMQTGSAFDHAGFSVSGGGDINDDGLADIIVGAFVDFSGLDSGAAYVLFGERNGATAGGAGNDFLFGGFGNQTLTGLAGNDYLEGGGAADILDGGADNDRIVYDPVDSSAQVTGGAGTDTLVVFDMAAPTGYNLAAGSFEAAEVTRRDDGSQSWSSIVDTYNASWQLTQASVSGDDGGRTIITLDPTNANNTSLVWNSFDPQQRLSYVDQFFDNGTRTFIDLDETNSASWSSSWLTYDAQARLDSVDTLADSGGHTFINLDQGNSQSWSQAWFVYDAQGRLDTHDVVYDDGSHIFYNHDQAGTEPFQLTAFLYDASGHAYQQVIQWDDGSTTYTDL